LQSGESDGFLYSSYAGRKAIATSTNFNDIREVAVVGYQEFYILISKKSKYAEIMPLVNSFIADYKKSGELDRIIDSTEKVLAFKNQFFYYKK
jgi:ABC-type amino acid transport substrate-binding protein